MNIGNVKWERLGDYISQCDERNTACRNYPVIGINRDKTFMPTVANLEGVDIAKYKVIAKGMFVFSGMQTGRDICIRIGLYDNEQPALISPAYTTFVINNEKEVLPEYFFLTSSSCHPKILIKERCDSLMPFHEHRLSDNLLVLWQCHLYGNDCLGKCKNLINAHVYVRLLQ